MDWLIALLIALSLGGNYVQYEQNQKLEQKVDTFQEAARENYEALEELEEAYNDLLDYVDIIEGNWASCRKTVDELRIKIRGYREADSLRIRAIQDLRARLEQHADSGDFDQCVFPEWVDTETPGLGW